MRGHRSPASFLLARALSGCLLGMLLLFACCGSASAAVTNPFTGGAGPAGSSSPAASSPNGTIGGGLGMPGFLAPALIQLTRWQGMVRARMSVFAGDIRDNPMGRSFWLLMLLALGYGVLHALGPGHGKIFAVSYFLHRPAGSVGSGLRAALLFGNLTMFFHVLSATLLVGIGYLVLKTSASATVDDVGSTLELISFGALCALGVGLTAKTAWELLSSGEQHGHHYGASEVLREEGEPGQAQGPTLRGLVCMALAAGIVPCPGAAMVLIFTVSLGVPWAGLWAMACIALGMGVSVSAVAGAVVATRGVALRLTRRHERLYALFHTGLALAGSLAITLVGGLMLWGRLAA